MDFFCRMLHHPSPSSTVGFPSVCPGLLPADIMTWVMHVGHQRTFLREVEVMDVW